MSHQTSRQRIPESRTSNGEKGSVVLTVNDDESVSVAFAAESMSAVRAVWAAVLGATNAALDELGAADDIDSGNGAAEDITVEPDEGADADIQPEAGGAAAGLEVLDEPTAGSELDPQAFSTSPPTATIANRTALQSNRENWPAVATLLYRAHTIIHDSCADVRLISMIEVLSSQFERARLALPMGPDRLLRSVAEHSLLLTAIQKRKPEVAQAVMRGHLVDLIDLVATPTYKSTAGTIATPLELLGLDSSATATKSGVG